MRQPLSRIPIEQLLKDYTQNGLIWCLTHYRCTNKEWDLAFNERYRELAEKEESENRYKEWI